MTRLLARLPVGLKIFGLATSMLALLLAVALLSYRGIDRVHDELIDIADFLVPISSRLAEIDQHVLEQEVLIGRLLVLFESEEPSRERIDRDLEQLAERSRLVDEEIRAAIALAAAGLAQATQAQDLIEYARLQPLFDLVENEQQEFQDLAVQLFRLHQQGNSEDARLLEERLQQEEDSFDRRMERLKGEIVKSTLRSTRSAQQGQERVAATASILTGVAAVLGLIYALLLTRALVRPIRELLGATREIQAGNLEVQVDVVSQDEIGTLADSFNAMAEGIRQKERIQATFGQYLDPRIVASLLDRQGRVHDEGEKQVMTVFFSDIAGFSGISETLTPGALVTLINQYLDLACEPILHRQGVIDKFIGDAVVAFWGPPFSTAGEHARLACWAALDQFSALERLHRRMPELMGFRKGLPRVKVRMGLATGELVAGSIGSPNSKSYTVIGDAPFVAEHLEGMNKQFGTLILLSEETRRLAGHAIETREVALVELPGETTPQPIFELLSREGELAAAAAELREAFHRGLAAYRDGEWDRAQESFRECVCIAPDDGPARTYLDRLPGLRAEPLPADWSGVWSPRA